MTHCSSTPRLLFDNIRMGVRRNFSREGNVDILLVLFRLLTMQSGA